MWSVFTKRPFERLPSHLLPFEMLLANIGAHVGTLSPTMSPFLTLSGDLSVKIGVVPRTLVRSSIGVCFLSLYELPFLPCFFSTATRAVGSDPIPFVFRMFPNDLRCFWFGRESAMLQATSE